MRKKYVETIRSSAKPRKRLSIATVLVATIILAIGAVTVVSRQKISSDRERKAAVANQAQGHFLNAQESRFESQTGVTRELTVDEADKLAGGLGQMINPSAEGLVQVQQPDGAVAIDLDGRFQNVTTAKIDKAGTLSQSCVDNPQAAGAFFGIDPQLIANKSNRSGANQPSQPTPAKNQN